MKKTKKGKSEHNIYKRIFCWLFIWLNLFCICCFSSRG